MAVKWERTPIKILSSDKSDRYFPIILNCDNEEVYAKQIFPPQFIRMHHQGTKLHFPKFQLCYFSKLMELAQPVRVHIKRRQESLSVVLQFPHV